VFALLIEHHHAQRNFEAAYARPRTAQPSKRAACRGARQPHAFAPARAHGGIPDADLWSGRQCSYSLICKMRERNIILNPYLDQEMVEQIHAAMGISSADELQGDDGIEEQLGDDY
jgi:hypothetical protein